MSHSNSSSLERWRAALAFQVYDQYRQQTNAGFKGFPQPPGVGVVREGSHSPLNTRPLKASGAIPTPEVIVPPKRARKRSN